MPPRRAGGQPLHPIYALLARALGPVRRALGRLGAALIRLWLRLFGRTFERRVVPWLDGPVGPEGEIGDRPYDLVAAREGLTIDRSGARAGLVPDFAVPPPEEEETCWERSVSR